MCGSSGYIDISNSSPLSAVRPLFSKSTSHIYISVWLSRLVPSLRVYVSRSINFDLNCELLLFITSRSSTALVPRSVGQLAFSRVAWFRALITVKGFYPLTSERRKDGTCTHQARCGIRLRPPSLPEQRTSNHICGILLRLNGQES